MFCVKLLKLEKKALSFYSRQDLNFNLWTPFCLKGFIFRFKNDRSCMSMIANAVVDLVTNLLRCITTMTSGAYWFTTIAGGPN